MPSSKSEQPGTGSSLQLGDAGLLRAETEQALGVETRLLVDPAFLGRMHAQLRAGTGDLEAGGTLLRAGFRHGLRDALSLLRQDVERGGTGSPTPARLALRFARDRGTAQRPAEEITGQWPLATEARACGENGAAHLGCRVSAGYTSGWLSGLWDAHVLAVETHCEGHGDGACRFVAREAARWQADAEPPAELAQLPFDALRAELDGEHVEPPPAPPQNDDRFDPDAPVIHVWGPVMVVPFSGGDESVHGVELIGREPGARNVRVVVIDLTGTVLDEAFGALALERVLDAVEGWGAEPILAGLGPFSAPVIENLERHDLMVEKDVAQAIAIAFQVADAQRRPA